MSFVGALLLWSLMQHPEAARLLRAEPVGVARGQTPVGIGHVRAWAIGSELADEGRGVALRFDGSSLIASQIWDAVDPSREAMVSMTEVTRYDATVTETWRVQFRPLSLDSYAVPRALIAAPTSFGGPWEPLAYGAGRWRGWVDFADQFPPVRRRSTPDDRPLSYVVALGESEPHVVGVFVAEAPGEGSNNGALCLAAGERYGSCETPEWTPGLTDGRLIVGGFFSGTIGVPRVVGNPPGRLEWSSAGGEDGYVLSLHPIELGVADLPGADRSFAITGPGDQRVTAVAVEPRGGDLLVAGWCVGATDLDPKRNEQQGPSDTQGRAMFFARYGLGSPPVLRWHVVVDTPGDDEAAGIAVSVDQEDPSGHDLIVVAGTVGDHAGSPGGPYIAAFRHPVTQNPTERLPSIKAWEGLMPGYGDDRLHALAVDGLGRICIAGRFGCPATTPPTSCASPYPLDFDPRPTHATTPEPAGSDAFVARYHPAGEAIGGGVYPRLEWVYRLGGEWNEGIYALATDPASTGRVATAGFFGAGAGWNYAIDADPGPATDLIAGVADADSFVAVLQPMAPASVRNQITLLLDNHCSIDEVTWGEVVGEVAEALTAAFEPGHEAAAGVPKDETVQINALAFNTMPHEGRLARPVAPWTVLDAETAKLFGARLRSQGRVPMEVHAGTLGNRPSEGLHAAALSQPRSGLDPALVHSSVLALVGVSDEPSFAAQRLRDARSAALEVYDRTNVLLLRTDQPASRERWIIEAVGPILPGPGPVDARTVGIAAGVDEAFPGYSRLALIKRLLTRLSFCPSDFNTDRCVRQTPLLGNDPDAFEFAFNQLGTLYSDWTLDGLRLPHVNLPKFRLGIRALPPGQQDCESCPPPQLP